ncbi:uncharacterized protein LOC126903371 [Daktulosphaira vitifoliae]|uniref:uncharacterized protein LOC126903371 n=1 Tax=Daktulosphaira vitifoliae TaxID=58002 RepID=UPI0021AA39AA|nr:uncharacterized protein LOC126903371 [Daktulosphaira vitifoliae]
MFSLKLVKFSVFLSYVILYTKAQRATNKQIDQLDKLLLYSGWKNLNVVKFVKYNCNKYHLENLIKTPTHRSLCMKKVRALTVHLGCTYAKVINNLFSSIINGLSICTKNKKRIYICTEGFIKIITLFIVPLATLMKGALDALDSIHSLPWAYFKKNYYNHYIMSPLLERIGDILDKLNERTLSRYDLSTYYWAFDTIYSFSKSIIKDLKNETDSYCEFVPYNQYYLWNQWALDYRAIYQQGDKLKFFKFITRKFKDYIKSVIIENYFQLGFKFDPITEETFVPTPEDLIIQELELKATEEEPPTLLEIETH